MVSSLPNPYQARLRIGSGDSLAIIVQKEIAMKRVILLLMLGAFSFAVVGCEAHAKVNDNGAKAGVTVDK